MCVCVRVCVCACVCDDDDDDDEQVTSTRPSAFLTLANSVTVNVASNYKGAVSSCERKGAL